VCGGGGLAFDIKNSLGVVVFSRQAEKMKKITGRQRFASRIDGGGDDPGKRQSGMYFN
jgi:hypothetical protein